MREIKFRAWDNGKMHKVSFNNLWVNKNHPSGIIYIRDENKPFGKTFATTLMQYTGLTDKNGTPIYEGDIVKLHGLTSTIHEIKFELGTFHFGLVKDGMCDYQDFEVIGNVYEHHHLMEEDK